MTGEQTAALIIGLGILGALAVVVLTSQRATAAPAAGLMLYQNAEEWEIVRDDSGRIAHVTIHRTAKAG